MNESRAWLIQLDSDWMASELFAANGTIYFHCQEIAKYQQVVEKSIRAIEAKLIERADIKSENRASFQHCPIKAINSMQAVFEKDKGLKAVVSDKFSGQNKADIRDICLLAPKLPPAGQAYTKNTEYPFNIGRDWTAPASKGNFSESDIRRFKLIASRMRQLAHRIYSS
jgi:hypothetical protein